MPRYQLIKLINRYAECASIRDLARKQTAPANKTTQVPFGTGIVLVDRLRDLLYSRASYRLVSAVR
jgi:hypothetical protein